MSPKFFVKAAAALFVALCISGCDDNTKTPAGAPSAPLEIRNLAQLSSILTLGLSTNEIAEKLGLPKAVVGNAGVTTTWIYMFDPIPADDLASKTSLFTHIEGVALGLSGGVLIRTDFIRSEPNPARNQKVKINPSGAEDLLNLYVVSDDPIPDGRFIDTDSLPKLGWVSKEPNLTIRKLKKLAMRWRTEQSSDGQIRTNCEFHIDLLEEDAVKMDALTSFNVGRRVLFSVGEVALSAPFCFGQIPNGAFVVTAAAGADAETAKTLLARIAQ